MAAEASCKKKDKPTGSTLRRRAAPPVLETTESPAHPRPHPHGRARTPQRRSLLRTCGNEPPPPPPHNGARNICTARTMHAARRTPHANGTHQNPNALDGDSATLPAALGCPCKPPSHASLRHARTHARTRTHEHVRTHAHTRTHTTQTHASLSLSGAGQRAREPVRSSLGPGGVAGSAKGSKPKVKSKAPARKSAGAKSAGGSGLTLRSAKGTGAGKDGGQKEKEKPPDAPAVNEDAARCDALRAAGSVRVARHGRARQPAPLAVMLSVAAAVHVAVPAWSPNRCAGPCSCGVAALRRGTQRAAAWACYGPPSSWPPHRANPAPCPRANRAPNQAPHAELC